MAPPPLSRSISIPCARPTTLRPLTPRRSMARSKAMGTRGQDAAVRDEGAVCDPAPRDPYRRGVESERSWRNKNAIYQGSKFRFGLRDTTGWWMTKSPSAPVEPTSPRSAKRQTSRPSPPWTHRGWGLSMAETSYAKRRRESIPMELREKGCEAPVYLHVFVPIYRLCRIGEFF